MAHSFITSENFKEMRSIKISNTLLYIYVCMFLEVDNIEYLNKSNDNYKQELIRHYEDILNISKYMGYIDIRVDAIYNGHKEIKYWYINMINRVETSLNKADKIDLNVIKKIPNYSEGMNLEMLRKKLKDLINDIRWILRLEGIQLSGTFINYHELYEVED